MFNLQSFSIFTASTAWSLAKSYIHVLHPTLLQACPQTPQCQQPILGLNSEIGISKNYCATNSGSPQVELRYMSMAHIVQILNWVHMA